MANKGIKSIINGSYVGHKIKEQGLESFENGEAGFVADNIDNADVEPNKKGSGYVIRTGRVVDESEKINDNADRIDGAMIRRSVTNFGNGNSIKEFMPCQLDGLWLESPVISFSQKKRIVSTPLVSGNGVVTEFVKDKELEFTITGVIVGDSDYPYAKVKELVKILKKSAALRFRNALYQEIAESPSTRVVVKGFNIPSVEGVENVQPYSITLRTDNYLDLYRQRSAYSTRNLGGVNIWYDSRFDTDQDGNTVNP